MKENKFKLDDVVRFNKEIGEKPLVNPDFPIGSRHVQADTSPDKHYRVYDIDGRLCKITDGDVKISVLDRFLDPVPQEWICMKDLIPEGGVLINLHKASRPTQDSDKYFKHFQLEYRKKSNPVVGVKLIKEDGSESCVESPNIRVLWQQGVVKTTSRDGYRKYTGNGNQVGCILYGAPKQLVDLLQEHFGEILAEYV